MSLIVSELSALIEGSHTTIAEWFAAQYQGQMPPFYSSVDLRHSGSKLAPVDTNLFPAGFNNLNDRAAERATDAARRFFSRYFPACGKLLLVPEAHTRNLHYLDNVYTLKNILKQAGMTVVLGTIDNEATSPLTLTSQEGHILQIHPLHKADGVLMTHEGFAADVIVINNDLTSGLPELLTDVRQPVIPSVERGWHIRRKSEHFHAYDRVVHAFSAEFSIDPFLISTLFRHCGKVNFKERTGIECVALAVEHVLHSLRQKYAEYGIADEPYVFIKADNGTYGMGIMTARSGEEVFEMNKKLRNKMGVIKEGVLNTEVIIQEGIPTVETIEGHVAEPMMYLMGGEAVGCIYRVNSEHDAFGNLNAHGMRFEKNICEAVTANTSCKFGPFALIAQLATLAATKEYYASPDNSR